MSSYGLINRENAVDLFDNGNFSINTEILPLLWIKNSSINTDLLREPSMIDTSLPISKPKKIGDVPSPGYYPNYRSLTPQQKWIYLRFLTNPYYSCIDIGYVFILYYGLERHLMSDKYHDAFAVISKLRSVHENSSFQAYSFRTLFATAILNKDIDILNYLSKNTDLSTYDTNTEFVIKALCHNELTCEDLIEKATFFNFTNRRYIKNEYANFYTALQEVFLNRYGKYTMPLYPYISGIRKTKKELSFANISLDTRYCLIPNFSSNPDFLKDGYDILLEAHNIVKSKLKIKKKK